MPKIDLKKGQKNPFFIKTRFQKHGQHGDLEWTMIPYLMRGQGHRVLRVLVLSP